MPTRGSTFPASMLIVESGLPSASARTPFPAATTDSAAPNLARRFADVARRAGDRPAITTAGNCWSYSRLYTAAAANACALAADRAFQPGDRVVLLIPNSVEYVAAFYGVLLAGGVVVPLPPRTESGALQSILDSTEATTLIAAAPQTRQAELPNVPARCLNLAEVPHAAQGLSFRGEAVAEHELAAIFYTAGSTGTPKGVMLTHRNLLANARSIEEYLTISENDRSLCVLPFYHAFGNSVMQSHLLAGAHLVLDGRPAFPETIIEAAARHGVTSLLGVPDLFRVLLERTSIGQTALPRLRYMAVAGGSLPLELALDLRNRIAPAAFYVMYGQTEATARLAYVPPERLGRLAPDCIGRAIPGVLLEVVDDQGRPVRPGEIGELRAKGPNVMPGYWRDAQATAERIRDGWLYTGDLATVDQAGWIFHKGRRSALVKIAGFRVHPGDLEDFAVRRLAVAQAVAVPFESAKVGTRLALFVRPAAGAAPRGPSEMLALCRADLPRHLVPDFIRVVKDFPLNHALKIDRPRLTHVAAHHARLRVRPTLPPLSLIENGKDPL